MIRKLSNMDKEVIERGTGYDKTEKRSEKRKEE